MDRHHVDIIENQEEQYKTWQCRLLFDLSLIPSQPYVVDLLDYVNGGCKINDIDVIQLASINKYPPKCYFRFPETYSGEYMFDALKKALNQSAEEQGFHFVIGKRKEESNRIVTTLVCNKFQIYRESKNTKRMFVINDIQNDSASLKEGINEVTDCLYAHGTRVATIRRNNKAES